MQDVQSYSEPANMHTSTITAVSGSQSEEDGSAFSLVMRSMEIIVNNRSFTQPEEKLTDVIHF